MRVLITAFEPFGGEKINPTMLLLDALTAPAGMELDKLVLPVEFGNAEARAMERLAAHPADCVISLGQAGGRSAITVERIAINLDEGAQIFHVADVGIVANLYEFLPKLIAALKERKADGSVRA